MQQITGGSGGGAIVLVDLGQGECESCMLIGRLVRNDFIIYAGAV